MTGPMSDTPAASTRDDGSGAPGSPATAATLAQAKAQANPGGTALRWWYDLTDPHRGNKSDVARLRRATSTVDALTVPAAMDLAVRLGRTHQPSVIDLARVLAQVDRHTKLNPYREIGWPSFPRMGAAAAGSPKMSEAAFRRFLAAERADGELASAFIRLIRLAGGECNVARLAEDFLFWGDARRIRMSYDYYGTAHLLQDPDADASSDTAAADGVAAAGETADSDGDAGAAT